MTSLLSILMVIMMVFSSIGGMTATAPETSSFDVKLSVDADMLSAMIPTAAPAASAGETEEAAAAPNPVALIADILNVLKIQGVSGQGVTELDLFAGDDLALSIGVKNNEEGALLASNLLGKQVIFASNEMLQQLTEQMMSSMTAGSGMPGTGSTGNIMETIQSLDFEQISKDVTEVFGSVTETVNSKIGEPETGEFGVDGHTYTVKTPMNITYDELMELVLGAAKELAGKESLKPIIEMASPGQDLSAEIDKKLAELKEMPEEQKYQISAAAYADGDACSYFAAEVTRDASEDGTVKAENIHIGIGTVDKQTKVLITSAEANVDLTAAPAEDGSFAIQANVNAQGTAVVVAANTQPDGSSDVTVDVMAQGMPVRTHTVTGVDGERRTFTAEVFLGSMEKPMLTVTGSSGKGGEPVSVFEGEDIKSVSFEELADPENQTAAGTIQMSLMTNLLKTVTALTKNLPPESAEAVSMLVKNMMSPGGATETQTVPAANP